MDLTPSAGADYPDAADEICAEVSRRFAQAQTETPRSFEQAEELMAALDELARQGQAALGQVTPPPDRAEDYRRYLASRAEVAALIEEGLNAAREGDGEGYQRARDEVGAGAEQRERLARAARPA